MRDWIGSPVEWGTWGQRANAWFNELVRDDVTSPESFYSGWGEYGGTFGNLSIRKSARGMVAVTGLVLNTSGTSISPASNMFVLPVGYRPETRRVFAGLVGALTNARLDVYDTGVVQFNSGAAVGAGGFISVDMTFYAGN